MDKLFNRTPLGMLIIGIAFVLFAYTSMRVYLIGLPVFGAMLMVLGVTFVAIYSKRNLYAFRFIYPGLLTVSLFIIFPILYTIYLGFTNYSSFNLLSFERAREVLLLNKVIDKSTERAFQIIQQDDGYRVFFPEQSGGYLSEQTALAGDAEVLASTQVSAAPGQPLAIKDIITLRNGLSQIAVSLPDGTSLKASGLRTFANVMPLYTPTDNDQLRNNVTGQTLSPNHEIGFYQDQNGEKVAPGWRVVIGVDNFTKVATNEGIREPFVAIFIWTFVFAFLSVALTFVVGVSLAVTLQWEHLRGKAIYRILLILPYAVPSFLSILIFRGLFNPNFGEINLILEALFGIRPEWFSNPWLARTMILIVNTWLGYPYMMLLAMGFLQAVPADQKKAAAIEGASPFRVFMTITLPQIIPPFLPLLLASFAFNFNNLVLIILLTKGGPDMPGTLIPAGQTDILASFMYRMAFDDSGQQFGLASAITLVIFVLVTAIAYSNFRALRQKV